jgi:catechol 2,3-dioxygenase-like lactoylglutathione lyase family enzyme
MNTMTTMKSIVLLLVGFLAAALPLHAEDPVQGMKISHVAVQARNVEQSVAFYRDFLGFAESSRLKYQDDGALMLVNLKVSDDQWIEVFNAAKLKPGRDPLYQVAFRVVDAKAMRARCATAGFRVPERCPMGQTKNLNFTVQDPSGYTIEFVQYLPEGWPLRDQGRSLPDTRVSELITHAGVVVANVAAANHFYGDILGLKETWRGSAKGDVVSWIHMRVPPAGSYVEYMLDSKVAPHFCLEVAEMAKAKAKLESSPYRSQYERPLDPIIGKNRRRILNLYDPSGIRVELMEPNTVDGQLAPPTEAPLPKL